MSERSTSTHTPDTEPKPSMYIEGAPEALQLYKIDELRQAEEDHEQKLMDEADWFNIDDRIAKRAEAQKDFDNLVKEHLKANGVTEDDPKFDEYVALLRDYSIDNIPESVWTIGAVEDDGTTHPPLKLSVYEKVRETYGGAETTPDDAPETAADDADKKSDSPEEDTPEPDADKEPDVDTPEKDADTDKEPETDADKDSDDKEPDTLPLPEVKTPEMIRSEIDKDPAIIAARANVDEKKRKLAELTAARQSKLFSRSKMVEAFDAAQDEYEEAVMKLVQLEVAAEKTAGMERSDEDERLDATFKLIGHYQDVQRQAIEIMKDTKVGKFITFMTSGGTAKRIVKGVALGAVVGVAGSLLVGATGGAAGAGVAAAATMAGRFARAYASFDNSSGRGMEVVDASHRMSEFNRDAINESDAGGQPTSEAIDRVSNYLMGHLEEETRREQKKRRHSTYKALGAVAAGVTLAELAGAATDHFGSRGVFGGDHNAEAKGGHDHPGESGNSESDGSGSKPETPAPEVQEYSSDARTIQNGEGFFQTMQEMDIPAEDRAELLEKVGPQLHEVVGPDGQPIAYKMPNGEWGIRMTPDGKMPTEALDLIHTTHEQMIGGSGNGVDAGSSAESVGGSAPSSDGIEFTDSSDASTSTETVADTSSTPEALNEPIDHSSIDVITKETLNAGDITNNTELMDLSHVATWYTPESFGQKLGLSATEWQALESQIIAETNSENRLYTNAFEVQNGYLRFTGNRIPADTMADMLNRIPRSTRFDLAA